MSAIHYGFILYMRGLPVFDVRVLTAVVVLVLAKCVKLLHVRLVVSRLL